MSYSREKREKILNESKNGTLARHRGGKKGFYRKKRFIIISQNREKKVLRTVPTDQDASHHTLKHKYGRSRVA